MNFKEWQRTQELEMGDFKRHLFRREAPMLTLVFFGIFAASTTFYPPNRWLAACFAGLGLINAYLTERPSWPPSQRVYAEVILTAVMILLAVINANEYPSKAALVLQALSPYLAAYAMGLWIQRYFPQRSQKESSD